MINFQQRHLMCLISLALSFLLIYAIALIPIGISYLRPAIATIPVISSVWFFYSVCFLVRKNEHFSLKENLGLKFKLLANISLLICLVAYLFFLFMLVILVIYLYKERHHEFTFSDAKGVSVLLAGCCVFGFYPAAYLGLLIDRSDRSKYLE